MLVDAGDVVAIASSNSVQAKKTKNVRAGEVLLHKSTMAAIQSACELYGCMAVDGILTSLTWWVGYTENMGATLLKQAGTGDKGRMGSAIIRVTSHTHDDETGPPTPRLTKWGSKTTHTNIEAAHKGNQASNGNNPTTITTTNQRSGQPAINPKTALKRKSDTTAHIEAIATVPKKAKPMMAVLVQLKPWVGLNASFKNAFKIKKHTGTAEAPQEHGSSNCNN